MRTLWPLAALCAALATQASASEIPAPWSELEQLKELDQQGRQRLQELIVNGEANSAEFKALADRQQAVDNANMARLSALLERHGWPRTGRASHAAFLIVQHAEPDLQRRYFPAMQKAQAEGFLSATELGMLEDRLLVREGKAQIYGSQLGTGPDGKLRFDPIDDEAHVDERRTAAGMEPMSTYARHFKLIYPPDAIDVPVGRCPAVPKIDAAGLSRGGYHLVARLLLKADGRVEALRLEGHSSAALRQAIADAFADYRCLPADADQEVQALFSSL